jgi:hypothetical protein
MPKIVDGCTETPYPCLEVLILLDRLTHPLPS